MSRVLSLLIVALLYGCAPQREPEASPNDTTVSGNTIDSLEGVIAQLRKTPGDLLREAQDEIKAKDYENARQQISQLTSWQLSKSQLGQLDRLLSSVNKGLERQAYTRLPIGDTTAYRLFIHDYPASKFTPSLRQAIKKIRYPESLVSPSGRKRSYNTVQHSSGIRVGAICCDGSRSYATGRGACSHHGGVCQWVYE